MSEPTGVRASHALMSLTSTCSNACVFCGLAEHADLQANQAFPIDTLGALLAQGALAITFTGGEPTLVPDALKEAVGAARAAGFRSIGVQTNGHAFAALAAPLASLGLTDVHLSVHGPNATAHDYHTGKEGSFEALWNAAGAAHRAGLKVVATTVLTRSDYRVLSEMATLLRARGVSAWQLSVPHARGRAQAHFDRVYPRLGMAIPFALHALETARRVQLPAFVSGAPLCLLGPLATRSIASTPRSFHTRCDGCAARAACPGVDALYLARFDGDELRPREAPASTADAEPHASRFAGPGALAPLVEQVMHEPTQKARVSLPVVGRTQRAQNEVSTRDAKTGERLREILPALFEKRDEDET